MIMVAWVEVIVLAYNWSSHYFHLFIKVDNFGMLCVESGARILFLTIMGYLSSSNPWLER